jgi:hypothetical protein
MSKLDIDFFMDEHVMSLLALVALKSVDINATLFGSIGAGNRYSPGCSHE